MQLPKFTLRRWMIAVAILGIVLAMPPLVIVNVLFILTIPTIVLSQLPSRVRLAIEIPILIVLLALSVYVRQSLFYSMQADRATELANCTSNWAAVSKSSKARASLGAAKK